ncbi:MerR family transcriptional regulator [Dactylosporangium aurantiacum]|nr:MerR family transcriptional regulator [Dactylosporangium aurantiacum]MDG6108949.1 MerR family transcriptional regulator [Dactylosporangium aurantiacum]
MQFTIAEVAEQTGLTAHTLRYYERAGLLDPPERDWQGHRRYSEQDVRMLRLLTRLRATGMSIAGMRHYAQLCRVGPATFDERRALLEEHRRQVLRRMAELRDDLALIEYKIDAYYAASAQAEDAPAAMVGLAEPDLARP